MNNFENPSENGDNFSLVGLGATTDCHKLVEAKCREQEGRNANFILNLSYLNPNGFTAQSMAQMGQDKDNDSTNVLRTIANWVGEARRKFPIISDAQETEIAKFLLNGGYGNKSHQFRNKQAFLDRLEYSLNRWTAAGADPAKSLNLANTVSKSPFEQEHDKRLLEAKQSMDEAIAEHEAKYTKYLQAVLDNTITQERMDELMKPVITLVKRTTDDYKRIAGQKDSVKKASTAQQSLWGVGKIADFVRKVTGHVGNKSFLDFEAVSEEDSRTLNQLLQLKTDGYVHTIDAAGVNHILKRHPNITPDDFELLPCIIKEYDFIGTGTTNNSVVYKKTIDDDFYCVEEARTGRKKLAIKTFYKRKKAQEQKLPLRLR